MSGLFSKINLLLCSMQGIRNNELLAKTFETFSKSPIRPASYKITKENTNTQDKKNNSVKHLQRKQFSFTKISTESELKIMTHV